MWAEGRLLPPLFCRPAILESGGRGVLGLTPALTWVPVSQTTAPGTLRFVGSHAMTRKGVRLGIELMQPAGKNNGTIEVRSELALKPSMTAPINWRLTLCDVSF